MKLRILTATFMIFAITTFSNSKDKIKSIDNFTLEDFNGKKHSLVDYKDSKAIVLMFIATKCPISNDYNKRMATIANEYSKKGVTFLAINSNKAEPISEIKEHAIENKFTFPVLKDHRNVIADKLTATVTPDIFVLNTNFDILYHGRIDDSRRESEVKTSDLKLALDAILAGKPVEKAETKAFGCTIKRVDK